MSLEIIRAAYDTQGYTIEFTNTPWARAEDGVKKGKFDILPNTWYTDARAKELLYSEPFAENNLKFVTVKGDTFDYSGMDSLTGKKVGIVRSYGYGDDFTNADNFTKVEAVSFIINVKKLVAGRVELTLEDEIVGTKFIMNEDPSLLDKIRFCPTPFSTKKLYVTCGLANPRHKEIIEAFNKGLEEIKASGKYQTIMAKYGIK